MARFDLYLTYIQRILNSFSTYIQLISKHQPLPGLTELRLLHLEHNQLTGNRRSWIIFPIYNLMNYQLTIIKIDVAEWIEAGQPKRAGRATPT